MDSSEEKAYFAAVGARLAKARSELGLPQVQMIKALGVSLRAYQSYEAGNRAIPLEALYELHRHFHIDLNWLLLGTPTAIAGHDLLHPGSSPSEEALSRLSWLCHQMGELLGRSAFSPSILAEAIGEETPARLEGILAGHEAAPFKMLDAIAEYCSASPSWLKHGSEAPFPIQPSESNYGAEFCNELLSPPVMALHFMRLESPQGEVLIIKQISNRHFKTYFTGIRLSDEIGAMGHTYQRQFLETCQTIGRSSVGIRGYLIQPETLRSITSGQEHPLLTLKKHPRSHWAEDWWDADLLQRNGEMHEYWPGFNVFVKKVVGGKG